MSGHAGIGYSGLLILSYSCMTYIIILSWALLYLVFSFSSPLPWATCNNYWNTGEMDTVTFRRSSWLVGKTLKKILNDIQITIFCTILSDFCFSVQNNTAEWMNQTTKASAAAEFWEYALKQTRFFQPQISPNDSMNHFCSLLPDDECWPSQGGLRR